MNQLQLLRDYVTTMQREVESKNFELKTLTEQNEKLKRENQELLLKKSIVVTNGTCQQCPRTKQQVENLQSLCNKLQQKYDSLQRQKSLSSSVRVLTTSCSECSRVKRDNQELRLKNEELQRNQYNRTETSTKIYTSAPCQECPKLRAEMKNKDQLILSLKADISTYNAKILALQGQVLTLNATSSKPVVYTQSPNRQNDLQRIAYLNGQVQQYIALVNSLRSQIKYLNEQHQRYLFRIKELESRPREVQLVEKQFSPQILEQMRTLKMQVGQLSNDNILLRRQNSNLKRQIMNLQTTNHIVIEKPRNSCSNNLNEERTGRHYRKNVVSRNGYERSMTSSQNIPYPQKVKYDNLQRKIQMLQMENDYLKGTFYSQI